ncbi:hypothetical protein K432DRAFT_361424 [Lepidopterella palustris CBS 459.81]|uniref:SsDNA binding protein n=1 Tax=Lepidopterella palustris CBS 459.81 TaxID=1314670 RepID=A0A8E2E1U4_9PEZI|nr:hypothetical protein K432DRAFT_361424 [Lepidopterella palustris CBS 459.81]
MFKFTALRTTRLPTAASLSARAFSSTARTSVARMSIVGRLAAPPEEVQAGGDRTIVRYALGTSYGTGDNKKTSWFKIASFTEGPQKDFLMSLPKGSLLLVDADARMDSYTDAEGNKRTSLNLIQRRLDIISKPKPTEVHEGDEEGLVRDPADL